MRLALLVKLESFSEELSEYLNFICVAHQATVLVEKDVVAGAEALSEAESLDQAACSALKGLDRLLQLDTEVYRVVLVELFDILNQLVSHHEILEQRLVVASPLADRKLSDF